MNWKHKLLAILLLCTGCTRYIYLEQPYPHIIVKERTKLTGNSELTYREKIIIRDYLTLRYSVGVYNDYAHSRNEINGYLSTTEVK